MSADVQNKPKLPACWRHFFKGHKWWCRACDRETARQYRDVVELWWSVPPKIASVVRDVVRVENAETTE